jgi:hypothetical protein
MKTWLQISAAAAAMVLAGCVGYPVSPDYGAYPDSYPNSGYPNGGYPNGGYPNGGYPNGYPGNYPPPGGYANGYGQTIRCESTDSHTRHCDMDTRGGVYLSRRLSDASCTQGRTWGYDSRGVWVTGGCRGEFTSGAGGSYGSGYGQGGYGGGRVVRCESQDGHSRHCSAPVQRGVQLLRTLSDSACIEGRTWGWDRNGVWVDRGCRAEFSVY